MQVVGDGEHFLDGPAEPVQLPDDQGVTGAQVVQGGGQAGTAGGGLAGADLLGGDAAAPGAGEGVVLQLGILGVGGDAGQADEDAVTAGVAGDGEGRGGDRGVCQVPSVSKPSHNFQRFR